MDSTSPPQWSSLPSDLLFNIASILGTRIDLLSLRAVCNSWRSSLPLPPKTPLVKLPFPIDPNNPNLNPNRHGHFALSESFSYSLEPINRDPKRTWLIKIQESESGNVILKDPLARHPLAGLDRLPKVLNLLDYRVKEISKGYYVEFVEQAKASFEIMEVAPAKPRSGFGHGDKFKYLVKWFSDLFLIEKYHEDLFYWSESDDEDDYHIKFKIYKMNEEECDWVEMDGLKDAVLFLGDGCSFFVWAKDFAWWKGNCICFLNYLFMGAGSDGPGPKAGIFDFEDGISRKLSKFSSCSKLFWPPPSWLKHYP